MKKKIAALALAFAMLFASTGNVVSAADSDYGVAPAYSYTYSCSSALSVSGSTATCTSSAYGKSGTTTKIAIYQVLQKKTSSGSWTSAGSWQKTVSSSSANVVNSKSGLSSGTYRLYTIFTVYAGSSYEKIEKYSSTKTI